MLIGYRTVAFADRPLAQGLQIIADSGYNAVEICLENPDLNPLELTVERVAEITTECARLGLALVAVSYHGVRDQLEDRRQRTYAAIDLLDKFGAPVFVVASRTEDPARLPAQWAEAINLYRELADRCGEHGCKLAVEPQPGLVVRSTEDLVKIIRDCDHPNLAGNLDIAHASVTADDLSWAIYQLGRRLVHVHVADVSNGTHQHLVPGDGAINFDEVKEILDSVGYDGPIVIDIPRTPGDPGEVCRQAREGFRTLWGA